MAGASRFYLMAFAPLVLQGQDPLGDLVQLLNTPVISASRQERKASQSPGVITVLMGRDLRRRGYRSIAEALATVPGFYGIDDHLNVDLGLRGMRGGQRSANRIFKVMVDNQPVSFRPDGTLSLGPDFIPLGAVERIEILYGPASALYGANAFLGVIHIVTRHAGGNLWGHATVRAERERGDIGWGGEGTLLGGTEALGGLASLSLARFDRSGHLIPAISPALHANSVPQTETKEAWSKPGSLFLKGRWTPGATWTHEASLQESHQSTVAEWLDFGTLSHDNRIGQALSTLCLRSIWIPSSEFRLRLQAGYNHSRPWKEQLSQGSVTVRPRRDLATRGLDLSAEAQWGFLSHAWLVGGVDLTRDRHDLMSLYSVNLATGAEQRLFPPQGQRTFENVGTYLQLGFQPSAHTECTLQVRWDDHNLYGTVNTWRGGVVVTPLPNLSLKLLAGTSFKAPSPQQLYALPIYTGDLLGNPNLRPERARTLELSSELDLERGLRMRNSLYYTRITDLIDLLPFSTNLLPVNRAEATSVGLESELALIKPTWECSAGLTLVDARIRRQDLFLSEVREPASGFPRISGYMRGSMGLPYPDLGSVDVTVRSAGARRSTSSNTFENHLTPYVMAPYVLVDAGWLLSIRTHSLRVQVKNLLDRSWAEPGSHGYDLPGARREWVVAFTSRF